MKPLGGPALRLVIGPALLGCEIVGLLQEHVELPERGQRRAELVGDSRNEIGLKLRQGHLAVAPADDEVAARGHEDEYSAQACQQHALPALEAGGVDITPE